jgi:hypothetical protein
MQRRRISAAVTRKVVMPMPKRSMKQDESA